MGIVIQRGDTTYHILNVYLPTESADNLPDSLSVQDTDIISE